jgi:hypothetical protein
MLVAVWLGTPVVFDKQLTTADKIAWLKLLPELAKLRWRAQG